MSGLFSKIAKMAGGTSYNEENSEGKHTESMGAKDLCIKTLEAMNCKVEEDEKNGRLIFTYQGEHFVIYADNEYLSIDIWDMYWYEVKLDDLDNMARARRAVNEVNINNVNTVIYSTNEEENTFDIHTKRNILFQEMPDLEGYLAAMLGNFFVTQREFLKVLERIKEEEEAS